MRRQDKNKSNDSGMGENKLRIAIVSSDKCKPKKCRQECRRSCPVTKTGKQCILVEPTSKIAFISEHLCIGCGICVKKCPFEAITIINLPRDLGKDTTHRFGPNTFKLHRLPVPRPGQVLGLVGTNGIGKSTALKVLSGKLKPNLGKFDSVPDWAEILQYFRGSELQGYFTKMLEDNLTTAVKPQYVDNIPKQVTGLVGEILEAKDKKGIGQDLIITLELSHLLNRKVSELSGGELQRFAICVAILVDADVLMFDEPSSYLDIRQRIIAARVIRQQIHHERYIIVVEHDLSVLDYLSDYVCCLWGKPSVYGVVTSPFSVREGINIFLDGFIPTENLRFREESLTFKVATDVDLEEIEMLHSYKYPKLKKTLGSFSLTVMEGDFNDSEILVLLGENGTGKTTFIKMLAGILESDDKEADEYMPKLSVSYKPQTITAKFDGTLRQLLLMKIKDSFLCPNFQADVVKPMQIENLLDQQVKNLSGGELQRVAIILVLGKPADIYLIDEPSAYLDSEQRTDCPVTVTFRFTLYKKKTTFIVEHDFIMATYLANRVIVFEGEPGIRATALSPEPLAVGFNRFLKSLDVTFRRDPTNYRPRINKYDSVKDKEQKASGLYFTMDKIPQRRVSVLSLKAKINHFKYNNNLNHNGINEFIPFNSNLKLGSHTHLNVLPSRCFINNRNKYTLRIAKNGSNTSYNSRKDLKLESTSNGSGENLGNKALDSYASKWYSKRAYGTENSDQIQGENSGVSATDESGSEDSDEEDYSINLIPEKPWKPGDDLRLPYLMDEKLELSMDSWPENCFLRVKLFSYYKHLVNLAAERIKLGLRDNENLRVTNPMALPMRRKRWCYLSSAFIDKRSKDLIEIQEHVRVVDILPVRGSRVRNFRGLLMVPLPYYVSFDYWFEEVHKPVKSKLIHDLFRKRTWVSKYFLYHRDKHEKRELIERITSPELVDEVPLRLKKQHKADYYFYELGELRKLYKFIVARKAEDEARRFYGVRTPEIWEVDDVRFVGNYEDRKFDPDYSSVDRITKKD
ncbi:RNase L inhibitor protein [Theileria orientalis strain Shintoku]|uniref:RNase L inhibitor protein n=1 Tax=Theileria orientalis strain Shintoku TaxID=869250 RepID=J4C476_THEOR|nr:RNase L inhibitor protein [Theileria orientalis strain Shintoku]BAM41701.1 RNase L inhibitor protein [Theileria orientalis strain Shintoku]|eukprot:XP_009692002.1 RNase L inhibitor protein [Theileria orientalis strain Shintoku]